ncbi:Malonyl-[acyl-carrier protein] O-methyltransferase [Aliiroseovarius pelagivivens]|uniref:Malonyl-[acyl-carrier protein] O-methyltransferase n=1 Tax=Aliiroseovarius pelagivivens TaxID=1639690 RepID=A0A2R8AMA5_9RHOB|nr:class I SAM-dependent methyltransferase [Aliiroseovarius pelagivivens]SPF77151.1 Malonyl-[acyl-carrier protein] O-methyltransferase [Aliiroseovarius pelagivivens]
MEDRNSDENGWASAAQSWIKIMDSSDHFVRQHVIDPLIDERFRALAPKTVLDVGCGEGRYCRMLRDLGGDVTGLDPVDALVDAARERDPSGSYVAGFSESLPFDDNSFDLVLCAMVLGTVNDLSAAIAQMARVVKSGGHILFVDRTSFATASHAANTPKCQDTGRNLNVVSNYLKPRQYDFQWGELQTRNWHRPLSHYMQAFLATGLTLKRFDEPRPKTGPTDAFWNYMNLPSIMTMEWRKH